MAGGLEAATGDVSRDADTRLTSSKVTTLGLLRARLTGAATGEDAPSGAFAGESVDVDSVASESSIINAPKRGGKGSSSSPAEPLISEPLTCDGRVGAVWFVCRL